MDIEAMRRSAEAPSDATAADLDGVAADLAAAFTDDAMFDWFLRTDAKKDAARLKFSQFIVRKMAFGAGKIERPVTGGAAAIWMPFEWLGPQPLGSELRALPTLLGATGFSRFGRLAVMREDMDKHHPMERRRAYLWFLGVAPEAQGRGVGSRLRKVGTGRSGAAGRPAYQEAPTGRNVALYRRHGFEVLSEHRCRADAPLMWSMWREPQPLDT